MSYAHSGVTPTAGSWLLSLSLQQDSCLWTVTLGEDCCLFYTKDQRNWLAFSSIQILCQGTSLVVQWLSLCAPNAGGLASIPGQGTRSHITQLKITHATINNKYINILKTQHKDILKKQTKKPQNSVSVLCLTFQVHLPHTVARVGYPSCKSIHTTFYLKSSSSSPLPLE